MKKSEITLCFVIPFINRKRFPINFFSIPLPFRYGDMYEDEIDRFDEICEKIVESYPFPVYTLLVSYSDLSDPSDVVKSFEEMREAKIKCMKEYNRRFEP